MATKNATTKTNSKKSTNAKATKAPKATAKKAASAKQTKADTQTNDKPKAKPKPATDGDKKMSALDAAAKVLAESKEPMRAQEIIDQMAAKGYWTSPGGKTPHATVVAAIIREIRDKGENSRPRQHRELFPGRRCVFAGLVTHLDIPRVPMSKSVAPVVKTFHEGSLPESVIPSKNPRVLLQWRQGRGAQYPDLIRIPKES